MCRRESEASNEGGGSEQASNKRRLESNNLFHPFSSSPLPEITQKAAFIKQHAYCPHPDHQATRLATVAPRAADDGRQSGQLPPQHVHFECPDCGVPVYCTEGHWMEDYEEHMAICDTLREINEDEHDLRSGRTFAEFQLGSPQMPDAAVNLSNWDTYLYTRDFDAINDDRAMRHATRLLTYPVTIGSILHEFSPYSIATGQGLTPEGLKSFSG
jgi:mitochondrial splicing suppressor protein 51